MKKIISLLALAIIIALPFYLKNFHVFLVTQVLIYAIAIMGLNLLTGFNGQFSLGHSAFYAIGAFTSAILMFHFKVPFLLTIPASLLVSFTFGYLFGKPALKLEGVYLALATFALAIAMPQFLKFDLIEHWTGGVQGLVLQKPIAPKFLSDFTQSMGLQRFTSDRWLYYITIIALLATYFLTKNLINSRSGRALQAIRDNPIAAESMGINIARYKTLTFGVSAMITGLAGSLSAVVVAFVAPDSFTFVLSVAILVGLVVGGVGWLPGAIFGGIFVLFVPNIAESLHTLIPSIPENTAKSLSGAVYGGLLILIIYLMPGGLGGFLKTIFDYFNNLKGENHVK
jgi:branched-chain amino acid transport system permease protein